MGKPLGIDNQIFPHMYADRDVQLLSLRAGVRTQTKVEDVFKNCSGTGPVDTSPEVSHIRKHGKNRAKVSLVTVKGC